MTGSEIHNTARMIREAAGMQTGATHEIVQWDRILFRGSYRECQDTKRRWTEQHGNVELQVRRI